MSDPKRAEDFPRAAAEAIGDRAAERDQPEGERSMARAVAIFNAWTGHELSEADGWRFQLAVKQAREFQGDKFNADDYVDMGGYAGLLGETAARNTLRPSHPGFVVERCAECGVAWGGFHCSHCPKFSLRFGGDGGD